MKINKLSFVIFGVFILLIIVSISVSKYNKNKVLSIQNIDNRLLNAANTVPLILKDDFHDRATEKGSISFEEDSVNIKLLSELNNIWGLKYIYTVINKNGSLYITSSSATNEEIENNKAVHYFEEYNDVCQAFKDSLKTLKISFLINSDRWGKYKTVIVPKKSPSGNIYYSCADIDLNNFNKLLAIDLFNFLIDIAIIFILTAAFFLISFLQNRKINKELKKEIETRKLLEKELKLSQENLRNNLIEKTSELKKSETNFHTFFNNTDEIIIVFDNNGKIIEVNAATLNLTEYKYEELIGKNIKELQSDFFKFDLVDKINELKNIDNNKNLFSFPLLTKKGNTIYLEAKIKNGKWDDFEVDFLIAKDISEIKKYEEKFEVVFTSNPSPMIITEIDINTIIDINDAFCKTFGYEALDLVGKTIDELLFFYNPYQQHKINERLSQEGNIKNFEVELRHKSGSKIIANFNADIIEINRQKQILIVINDITENKKAEEQLIQKINQINALLSSVPANIFLKDKKLRYIAINDAFANMLNKNSDEIIGKTDLDLFPNEIAKKYFELENNMILNKELSYTNEENIDLNNNGENIWILTNRKLFFDSYGEVTGLVGTMIDITKTKASETELAQFSEELKRSNRDLEQFAYIASHDLQEPLRKVTAFSERLKAKYYDVIDETGKEYINRMSSAAERMQKMINDLLTFSRVSTKASPFSTVELDKIFENVLSDLELMIEKKKAKININGSFPIIEADENQLNQLFSNLISNAIKYQPSDNIPEIIIFHSLKDDNIEITIQDNGIGIDLQYKDLIFQPFQRLHGKGEYEGSGIGLAICKKIIDRHKGIIDIESEAGKGSKFIIKLPIKQNSQ